MASKYLIAVGHPDDEVLMCGGTIASQMKIKNDEIRVILTSDGNQDRHDVLPHVAHLLGFEFSIGPFPATNTHLTGELVSFFDQEIRDFQPDVIVTHSLSKYQSQDHNSVHRAVVISASRLVPTATILVGEPTFIDPEFNPVIFSDITHAIETKLQAAELYSSSLGRAYMAPKYLRDRAAYWGQLVKPGEDTLCEAFVLVRHYQGETVLADSQDIPM